MYKYAVSAAAQPRLLGMDSMCIGNVMRNVGTKIGVVQGSNKAR
jgi:hypothetical protein